MENFIPESPSTILVAMSGGVDSSSSRQQCSPRADTP